MTGNRTVNFTLAILGLLSGLFFYWLSLSSIEPVYSVGPIESVARRESPRLTVAWDGAPVENLCLCRIAFWNKGKVPLTQDKLTAADPLRIAASEAVHVLQVETTNVSRETLRVISKVVRGKNGDTVQLRLAENDGLDQNEGFVVRLLFTGSCDTTFQILGRVIGVQGIARNALSNNSSKAAADSLRERIRRGRELTKLDLYFIILSLIAVSHLSYVIFFRSRYPLLYHSLHNFVLLALVMNGLFILISQFTSYSPSWSGM